MPRARATKRSDGRYQIKFQGKWFYGKTAREATSKYEDYKRQIEAGLKADAMGISLERYASQWVESYKAHLSDNAYNQHVRMIRKMCAHKELGSMPIAQITTMDIQSFYNHAADMSYSYICDMRDTVRGIFKYAVADRIINYDPTLKAVLPKGDKGTHRAITQHERDLITATDHKLRAAVMVMLYAGLRRGEVMALDIDRDVDFAAKTITVREAVRFENNNQPIIVDPKSEAGKRTIPLLQVLADELRGSHGLVCSAQDGGLMSYSSWTRGWDSYITALETHANGCHKRWYGKTKEHKRMLSEGQKIPPWEDVSIRPHDLRHSFCTMLYDADVDLKTAQKWMGHADQEMTLRVYTHLSEEKEKKASSALENAALKLSGCQNGCQQDSAVS